MRRHIDGGQFTALARGSARAGAQGTRRLRNSLDGGGRHDVGTHHGVRQLIPQRGPTIASGPSSCQPPAPHPRPGSPARRAPANSRPDSFRLVTVPDVRGPGRAGDPTPESPCRPYGPARRGVGAGAACPARQQRSGCAGQTLSRGRTRTDDLPLTTTTTRRTPTSTCDNSSPRRRTRRRGHPC